MSSHALSIPFFSIGTALHNRPRTALLFHCQSVTSSSSLKTMETLWTDEFVLKCEGKRKEGRQSSFLINKLFQEDNEDDLKVLYVIDTIQHLGIDHHFQDLIGVALKRQYHKTKLHFHEINDLHHISLLFRLLRQQGYYIPSDVFAKFISEEGKFKEELSKDIKGLMALHEASHLSIQGEPILDEAARFSTESLMANMTHLDDHQAIMVQNTLQYPYHKSLAKFTAQTFIENLRFENEWEDSLVNLAAMDSSITQSLYQEEFRQILGWWKEVGLWEELKLARNQPLKWYIWSIAMVTDPSLSKLRIEITKPISLVYFVDDIFDVYGTLEELTLFTQAINRWEFSSTDKLPRYMKMCFNVIHDTTHEISNVVYQEFGWNPIDHLKKEWASLCNAFLTEAKWFASGHSPKADEYLKNGIISSGVPMVLTNLFFLLGYGESISTPDIEGIISSVAAILRLLDDLGTAKDEQQEGKDGSYMEYYIKEKQDWSLSDGKKHVMDMVSQQWKLLNKHCLSPTPIIPKSFKKACLNVARLIPMMYTYNDNHRLPILEEHVKSMFSDIKEDFM